MSKFGFIANLEDDQKAPKKKYQMFEAEMGFEKAVVLIPLESADAFAVEAEKKQPKGRPSLVKLAEKYGGSVQ